LVVETLAGLAGGTIQLRAQDSTQATLARILDREDGRMDFGAHTATELWHRWKGFQPWPGAFTAMDGKKLIVHRLGPVPAGFAGEPGGLRVEGDRLLVCCAEGSWLELMELQLEGKKRMSAAEFLRGNAIEPGQRLGL
jgi:methionyl-tRNA formyltransferase